VDFILQFDLDASGFIGSFPAAFYTCPTPITLKSINMRLDL